MMLCIILITVKSRPTPELPGLWIAVSSQFIEFDTLGHIHDRLTTKCVYLEFTLLIHQFESIEKSESGKVLLRY